MTLLYQQMLGSVPTKTIEALDGSDELLELIVDSLFIAFLLVGKIILL